MRKITEIAVSAFLEGRNLTIGNTSVKNGYLSLHGNEIARKGTGEIFISNAGCFSNTTKERLNGIPGVSIYQKKGLWYLNGKLWDGKWTPVFARQI